MFKPFSISGSVALLLVLISLTFCDKKEDPAPESTPETASPTPTTNSAVPVYTFTSQDAPLFNPCTTNSTLQVSTTFTNWTFSNCVLGGLTLTGTDGTSTVILTFATIITSGTYVTTSGVPLPGEVRITVLNAPLQPTGILWYSKSGGSVSVTVGASTTIAAFVNIPCTQALYPLPIVYVNGDVGCQ